MPYANPEQQREYQRNWVKLKKEKQHSSPMVKNIIYWDDLQDIKKIREIKDFQTCIKEAKRHLFSRKVNRIAVAELAIQACVIKWGGDRRTKNYRDGKNGTTLKGFAKEIEISHKTLFGWIDVKTKIIDKLKKESGPVDWTAAQSALKHCSNKSGKNPIEFYDKYKNNSSYRNAANVAKYLSVASNFIVKYGSKVFEKRDWNLVIGCVEKLNEAVLQKG